MGFGFLTLAVFAFGAFGAQASAADICTEPVKAVCDAPPTVPRTSAAQIRSEVSKSLGGAKLSNLSGDAAVEPDAVADYRKYVSEVSKKIGLKLARMGIKESDLKARIVKIADTVAKNLEEGRTGLPLAGSGPLSDAELAAKIRGAAFEDRPVDDASAEDFYSWCGVDGLVSQAFYSSDGNKFVLCPGFLLDMLNSGTIDMLDFTVAHELSHAADGDALSERHPKYVRYLSCVQSDYSSQFNTIDEVIRQLGQPAQDRLQARLDGLKKNPAATPAQILETQYEMRVAKGQVADLTADVASFQKSLGRAPTVADSHSAELTADLGGYGALIRMLKDLPKAKRPGAIAASLKFVCDNSLSAARLAKYGPLNDDAMHPPQSFRVGFLLNNPEIRSALGCQQLIGQGPWCPSGDTSPIAARCTRAMGVSSASQCEKMLAASLGSAGCQVGHLGCDAFDGRECDCSVDSSNCEQPYAGPKPSGLTCAALGSKQDLKLVDPPIPGVCLTRPVGPPAGPASAAKLPEASKAK